MIEDIKYTLLKYFISDRGFAAATEVPYINYYNYVSDVLSADTRRKRVYEVEIKTSISDLKRDLKKRCKHKDIGTKIKNATDSTALPNYFYFCVPINILEETIKFVQENTPNAGIMLYENYSVTITRKAKLLHKGNPHQMLLQLLNRMSREYFRLIEERYDHW